MNYVLVDYENITAIDLKKLDRADTHVIIFLGNSQAKVPADLVMQMQALGSRGEYIKICGQGPNALDFHIAFVIGERSTREGLKFFHIVSKDTGFDPLLQYLKDKGIRSSRVTSIDALAYIAPKPPTAGERAAKVIEKFSVPKCPRPRSQTTLTNSVQALFQRSLAEAEVKEIIQSLVKQKFLALDGEKITYLKDPA